MFQGFFVLFVDIDVWGIHSLEGIDWDVQVSYEQYLEKTINTGIRPWYLKGLDKLKLFDLEKRSGGNCRNTKGFIWDFSIHTF